MTNQNSIQAEKTQAVLLVKHGFEDAEAIIVLDFLRRMNLQVQLVSCESSLELHSYWGLTLQADALFSKVKDQSFDGVIVVGGPASTSALEQDPNVVQFIRRHLTTNKLVAAECSAPAKVLGHNGLLAGHSYTCSSGLESTVNDPRATFVDAPVVQSGNLLTCKGLAHTFVFSASIAKALGCSHQASCEQLEHIYLPQEQLSNVL